MPKKKRKKVEVSRLAPRREGYGVIRERALYTKPNGGTKSCLTGGAPLPLVLLSPPIEKEKKVKHSEGDFYCNLTF